MVGNEFLGRDLIIYILQNGLEDKPVFENGRILGFITIDEAAVKFGVGIATIRAWISMKYLIGFDIGGTIYIPANMDDPRKCLSKGD